MYKYRNFLLTTVLSLGFISTAIHAEDTTSGTVEANVINQAGNVISGASISIKNEATGQSRSSVSDSATFCSAYLAKCPTPFDCSDQT